MLDTSKIKYEVRSSLNILLKEKPEVNEFYNHLKSYGDLIMVGGALRDLTFQEEPRDLDLIINYQQDDLDKILEGYNYRRNRFGGYNLRIGNIELDVWSISSHWAFKENIYECAFENITRGAFYNFDALALNLQTLDIDIGNFIHTLESKTLDLNLDEEYVHLNPSPSKNIMRALRLKKTWELSLSEKVTNYCYRWIKETNLSLEDLLAIEYKHYGDSILNKLDYDLILENDLF